MKILLTTILVLTFVPTMAQNEMPTKEGKVHYEHVDSIPGASRIDLYNRARLWLADAFVDSKEVVQVEDKESGLLVGKGSYRFQQGIIPYRIKFSVRLDCKDQKYRAQIYDVYILSGTKEQQYTAEFYNEKKNWDKVKNKVNERMAEIIEEIQTAMSKSISQDF